MADSGSGDPGGQRVPTPGGSSIGLLMGRRASAGISPGRLPSVRSRDLTLGGVKKVMHFSSLRQRVVENVLCPGKWLKATTSSSIIPDFVIAPALNHCLCFCFFRKRLHPTLSAEKPKRSKFITDAERQIVSDEVYFNCVSDCGLITSSVITERKGKAGRGERGGMEIEVEVREIEAGAGVAQRSSSPTLFLNRGPQRWWWRREVGVQLRLMFFFYQCNDYIYTCLIVSYLIPVSHRWLWKWERRSERGTVTHHQY